MSAQPAREHQYLHPTRALCVRLGRTPDEPAVTVTGEDDTSALNTHYDSRCTLCWLGAAHSEAIHAQRVQR